MSDQGVGLVGGNRAYAFEGCVCFQNLLILASASRLLRGEQHCFTHPPTMMLLLPQAQSSEDGLKPLKL